MMHDPPHPGEAIRELCVDPLGLTVTGIAKGLGVRRKAFSELLNGHAGVSPEMAVRLSKAFGGSPESWLRQQMQYDLWHARRRLADVEVKSFADAGEAPLAFFT
jgi:antitoxin HigA-1